MADLPDDEHYRMVANRLISGAVVPFLGAGVGLCGRPERTPWEKGRYLPSGAELAQYLAQGVDYPAGDPIDLLRVSQYVDVKLGNGPLYEALHAVFDADYLPTPVHRLLAALPEKIRAQRTTGPRFFPLYVTTNYDSLLEQALVDAGEEYDLVTYIAEGPDKNRFVHTHPSGETTLINVPNTYPELRCDERPVVAKIHGAVGRRIDERDSFVVTENHYIAYLSHSDIAKLIPVNMTTRMRKSHFLFLGYSLKDWNLRVILQRLWGDEGLTYNSWAIQPAPERIDERAWNRRGVELLDSRLEEYTVGLECAIDRLLPAGAVALTTISATTEVLAEPHRACPYIGLQPYGEADKDYFFGRESDRDLIIANLMASRLTILYGPSGVGKSSLLQAAVVPHLRHSVGAFPYVASSQAVVIYQSSWRDDPAQEIGRALCAALPDRRAGTDEPLPDRISVELVREVSLRLDADIYLLCDQFEEEALYQSGARSEAFAAELGRIVTTPGLRANVLLGIREDALAKLDRLDPYLPDLFSNSLRLDHLSAAGARDAIERPLERYAGGDAGRRMNIEPSLVVRLLDELRTGHVVVTDGRAVPVGRTKPSRHRSFS